MTSSWSELGTFLARAERDLLSPAVRLDVEALARLWRYDEVTVVADRPEDLEDHPDLALRLRGAMGRALRAQADRPRRADPFGRPTAWQTLFALEPPRAYGREVGRPFVTRMTVGGRSVEATVRLFGWAGLHAEEVGEAVWTALGGGLALRTGGRFRVPFLPRTVSVGRVEGVSHAAQADRAALMFDTPVVIRAGDRLQIDPTSIIPAGARRVASLAPWMEYKLDWREAEVRAASEALTYDLAELTAVAWRRFSVRRPDAPIPVYAFQGRVRIQGALAPLAPYLAMAETCGLGSHAALGFGRMRAVVF